MGNVMGRFPTVSRCLKIFLHLPLSHHKSFQRGRILDFLADVLIQVEDVFRLQFEFSGNPAGHLISQFLVAIQDGVKMANRYSDKFSESDDLKACNLDDPFYPFAERLFVGRILSCRHLTKGQEFLRYKLFIFLAKPPTDCYLWIQAWFEVDN